MYSRVLVTQRWRSCSGWTSITASSSPGPSTTLSWPLRTFQNFLGVIAVGGHEEYNSQNFNLILIFAKDPISVTISISNISNCSWWSWGLWFSKSCCWFAKELISYCGVRSLGLFFSKKDKFNFVADLQNTQYQWQLSRTMMHWPPKYQWCWLHSANIGDVLRI